MGRISGFRGRRVAVLTIVGFGLATGIAYATNAVVSTSPATSVIQACKLNVIGTIRIVSDPSKCSTKHETPISWNVVGPSGPQGAAGANGTDGTNGAPGAQGPTGPTGASGVAATQIVFGDQVADAGLGEGTAVGASVDCPEGKVLFGGGATFQGLPTEDRGKVFLVRSQPFTIPPSTQGWSAAVRVVRGQTTTAGFTVTAYAICSV